MMNKLLEGSLIRQPEAWLPLVLSLAALLLIFGYVALHGATSEPGGDEGTAARLFQLLLLLQLGIMLYFAFKWLPGHTRPALIMLLIQAIAWLVPVALIIWLER